MYCAEKAKGSKSFQAFHRPVVERLGPKHRPIVVNNRDGENVPLTALGRTHISHEVFFMQPLHDEQDGRVRGVPAGVQGLRIPQVALLPADGQRVQRLNGVVDEDAAAESGRFLPAPKPVRAPSAPTP